MTIDDFMEAFGQEWTERTRDETSCDQIAQAYRHDGAWTNFMLGRKQQQDGFLDAVGRRLKRSVGKEWFYLDCVLYREEPQLIGYGVYPAGYDVVIEHENGEQVEQEMWKQLMWRSPLKVLIFYDYLDNEREANEQMARWLDSKIAQLRAMVVQTWKWWPENEASEYLLIVGSASCRGALPQWRHFSLSCPCP
ncbi:MAG: hypothetical protein OXU81_13205 [Gammaproteobacteria bacterium]|nr:hypothetical protein [Gammaproteobacteria bacterium]